MVGGNGMFYPILGFASVMAFVYMSFGDMKVKISLNNGGTKMEFVERNGSTSWSKEDPSTSMAGTPTGSWTLPCTTTSMVDRHPRHPSSPEK